MSKLTLTMLLAGGLALPCVAAPTDRSPATDRSATPPATPQAPTGPEGRRALSFFELLDTNKDGYIDRAEAAHSGSFKANFDGIDLDHDGRISRAEWESFEANSSRG